MFARILGLGIAFIVLMAALTVAGGTWYLFAHQPSPAELKDTHLQVPLRVYTRDEQLIGQFGGKRRIPLAFEDIPDSLIKAVLAAEDKHFYEHPGVDWEGLTRAVIHLARTGKKGPGGSTITMQVARNFFLGREKTYLRKANEILLALRIEREFTKDEILSLYLNKIFFGQRAYGVGAAARVYYGAELGELTLPQVAMIAGLPKAPSRFNPIADPVQAKMRRNYVLRRMRELAFIDDAAYTAAIEAPITARLHGYSPRVEAPYVAEMARAWAEEAFGDKAYTHGYRLYTSIDSRYQRYANEALHEALLAYDRRHGYRGPARRLAGSEWELPPDMAPMGRLVPAVVKTVAKKRVRVVVKGTGELELPWKALSWARRYVSRDKQGPKPKRAGQIVKPGDVIWLEKTESGWRLAQVPEAQGALVAMDPMDGAVRALVGGFNFYHSKFNRATQAKRQPGSSFKPFVYAVALETGGFTPATTINDAPIVDEDPDQERDWRPENYSGKFYGPTRLREALVHSRNLVSVRLLRRLFRTMGIKPVLEALVQFGFDPERLPPDLSLALGSGTLTPLELATAYSLFANGGYRVASYFVDRAVGPDGVVFEAEPPRVCRDCEQEQASELYSEKALAVEARAGEADTSPSPAPIAPRIISAQGAWLVDSMLGDVIQRGTGRRAKALERTDLAGKTGTTNDQKDAWFCGFTPNLVATAWVGFDRYHSLGHGETGGRAALPMWMAFMGKALEGVPEAPPEQPDGLVTVRIDSETGERAPSGRANTLFETFRAENIPSYMTPGSSAGRARRVTEQLF
uniref:Penicillin-binding protein 1A n=1 Tax=Candidatus Kentrum eta TaxID=2126337 RepID=A0A450UDE6_9GAMM|nr:MAG: penicillin-binding protein 1A [Candidatus Kentron sp. H]VFJ91619.1 MAG: penicillin-binding protein 1A [Candidatus Kentron sp. H]VFJ98201.1 MAG: penicillin-binding protein 1A [Candidatus Kentron sp. H]